MNEPKLLIDEPGALPFVKALLIEMMGIEDPKVRLACYDRFCKKFLTGDQQ
jgi:hypothetical protein